MIGPVIWAFKGGKKKKVWFYIALYPVHWTAQSALHFPPLADLFIPTPFSASLGSILAMQQLRKDYSLTFPPLSIARYSFIQLSRLRRREVKENAQTSKRYQRGFEPGISRLRVRHSTTEPPRSTVRQGTDRHTQMDAAALYSRCFQSSSWIIDVLLMYRSAGIDRAGFEHYAVNSQCYTHALFLLIIFHSI